MAESNDIQTIETNNRENEEYLRLVTRSSVLLTIIIPFLISISVLWTLHRFAFELDHYSMCVALVAMALDSVIDIVCVLLLFKYADSYYNAVSQCQCIRRFAMQAPSP